MHIREATVDDNAELIQLQKRCPQGTTIIVSTVNTPDFFARAKVYEEYKVFAACEDNKIVASAACGLRKAMINNKVETIGHEFQAFVDPAYRGRRIAGQLHQARKEYLIEKGAVLSYGIIMEGNNPSIRHVERQGFRRHFPLTMPGIAVYKEMEISRNVNIRNLIPEDLSKVTTLVNNTWQGYEFYEPMTAEDFNRLISRIPEYDNDNVFVLEEDDDIKACLGFWDWSKVTQVTVKELSWKMRLIAFLLDVTRIFHPVPHPPRSGKLLKQIVLTPIGFKDITYISTLLRYVNNIAYSKGIEELFFICRRGHPLLSSLKGFIHIDTGMNLYVKPLRNNLSLSNQPVFINGLDL